MYGADDSEQVVASLARQLDGLTFRDATTDQVTKLIIDSVVGWGRAAGWRVYRRAASVVPLPPPLSGQYSVLDVACARPAGPPVVVEVDHTDRRRTVEKLLAEAAAGRVAIWVRWGTGRFVAPPPPVLLVTCPVTRLPGPAGQGRRYSRLPADDRPPPAHSATGIGSVDPVALPIPLDDDHPR
ncbi:hypothetical protein [Micromonospora cathayae]|uniref:Uncharacterized protein n=1 Tax=Micromonospora cathayae TaxID=3028804 RepID=A0ABY7ZKU2_9ACTN|nr:hypothetical protein [Micromonospora sp. HUAS 3]WDZ82718.1 hypothetical protein PVK37_19840 [Micromonospora sp. HUAS 3]